MLELCNLGLNAYHMVLVPQHEVSFMLLNDSCMQRVQMLDHCVHVIVMLNNLVALAIVGSVLVECLQNKVLGLLCRIELLLDLGLSGLICF